MENQKLFLYIGLVLMGWLIYQQWQFDYHPLVQTPAVEASSGQTPNLTDASLPDDVPGVGGVDALPPEESTSALDNQQTSYITVTTDRLVVMISTRGGSITQVGLKSYPTAVDQPDQPFQLMSDDNNKYFVAQSGLRAAGLPAPTHHDLFTSAQSEYQLASGQQQIEIPLIWEKDGVKVTKIYTFSANSYVVDLKYQLENQTGQTWRGRQYQQLQRKAVTDNETSKLVYTFIGGVLLDEENKYEKLDFDKFAQTPERDITGSWAAIIQHYFLAAWIPKKDELQTYYTSALTQTSPVRYVFGFKSPLQNIASGTTGEFHSRLYVGPKEQDRLKQVADKLQLAVDYGKLTIIADPLFWLLRNIHHYVGNWGWSIVLLTLIIKLAFYKLSEKQYRSMARMRQLQPKMLALKERHGDDRQKLGQATMELYKKEKVNPLGGCWPMLVQIPVFIALYWMLLESVELRQAPFMLWIKDMSVKDPYYVLPLIMGVTMYIQQKLNPTPVDPIQAKVFMLMPFIFTVFFAFFPAGLVIYWLVNNILSIAQQYYITRHVIADIK